LSGEYVTGSDDGYLGDIASERADRVRAEQRRLLGA